MIYASVVMMAVLAATASAAHQPLYTDNTHSLKTMWESFKSQFHKSYLTMEEERTRYQHFVENLKLADLRNQHEARNNGGATHGITRFSDMSQSEFEATLLTVDSHEIDLIKKTMKVGEVSRPVDDKIGLVDWTGKYTTAVKDQGYCGSCWAFSATEQIESDAMRELGITYTLSPEQITQCAKLSSGCDGGATEAAYEYVKGVRGVVTEADYPYTITTYEGVTGICNADTSKAVIAVSDFFFILAGETAMASFVQATGPLSVCVDASLWNTYTGGVMSHCGNRVNHCVQAVGVEASSSGYWKVRNSWGAAWGEEGYIRLAYGKDTCAISNDPTYTLVRKV